MIEKYLDDLETRIDPDTEDRILSEWRDFAFGKFDGEIFSPQRAAKRPPSIEWPVMRINEAMTDYEKMAYHQLRGCSDNLTNASGTVLCVRSNYGTGIVPSVFGAELFMMDDETDTLPTSRPVAGGIDGIMRLLDAGVPNIENGLGAKVFGFGEYFRKIQSAYPKIGKYVFAYHPDLQGPMDVVELLWGSELFTDVYDRAELVKRTLDLVTETYTLLMRRWYEIHPPSGGTSVHWGMMHRGEIMLRDDSAMNFSPDMFDEFIRPWDARLLAKFNGGAVHFCGRGDHYIASLAQVPGLYAINMSQPHLNEMETIYRNTVDRGIMLIGLRREAALEAVAKGRKFHGGVHSAG